MAKPRILQQLDGELSTDIVLNSDPDQSMEAVTKQYVDAIEDNAIEYMNNNLLSKNNDNGNNITLTNANITLTADPTTNMQAATKQYVDNSGGTLYAIYGSTTYNEIKNAYDKGCSIFCIYDDSVHYSGSTTGKVILSLMTPPTGSNTLTFSNYGYPTLNYVEQCHKVFLQPNNTWGGAKYNPSVFSYYKKYSGESPIDTADPYYRPIRVSTSAPKSTDGYVGDIWIQYST